MRVVTAVLVGALIAPAVLHSQSPVRELVVRVADGTSADVVVSASKGGPPLGALITSPRVVAGDSSLTITTPARVRLGDEVVDLVLRPRVPGQLIVVEWLDAQGAPRDRATADRVQVTRARGDTVPTFISDRIVRRAP